MVVHFGTPGPDERGRVREILDATGVFRPDEVDVALELFDEATNGVGRDARQVGTTDAVDADYELLGAYADGTLAGYACFGPTPSTDRTFDLYWIAMHPDAQGSGGGSRLLGEVEQRLRNRAGRLIVVETSSRDDYLPTRHFYEARGYSEAARIRDFYAPADDRVIYTKRLLPFPDVTRSDLDE